MPRQVEYAGDAVALFTSWIEPALTFSNKYGRETGVFPGPLSPASQSVLTGFASDKHPSATSESTCLRVHNK